MKRPVIPILLILLGTLSCEKESTRQAARGELSASQEIDVYTPAEIRQLLVQYNFDVAFELVHSVRAVKIEYTTSDPGGNLTRASGAIFLPQASGAFPLFSYQHGTQIYRYLVPSQGAGGSDAGIVGSVVASMGYICMAADYLGLGESRLTAPYLLAENSAATVIDLLRAGKKYLDTEGIETDGSLYLTGYSQGGHVTMATHHEIEKNYPDEFSVTASAPLAGPYDLLATVDTVLSWNSYLRPVLIALLLNSYDHYYGWNRLSDFFQEPYADAIPGYFNGSLFLDAVNNRLPQNLDELLHADFRSDFISGGESGIRDALRENSLLNYVPSAPVRLIHGNTDRTVPFFNGKAARDYYEGEGKTNVELVMIEGNHEGASAPALIAAIQWFEELRSSRK